MRPSKRSILSVGHSKDGEDHLMPSLPITPNHAQDCFGRAYWFALLCFPASARRPASGHCTALLQSTCDTANDQHSDNRVKCIASRRPTKNRCFMLQTRCHIQAARLPGPNKLDSGPQIRSIAAEPAQDVPVRLLGVFVEHDRCPLSCPNKQI